MDYEEKEICIDCGKVKCVCNEKTVVNTLISQNKPHIQEALERLKQIKETQDNMLTPPPSKMTIIDEVSNVDWKKIFRESGKLGGKQGGSLGGKKRAEKLTKEQRSAIARLGGLAKGHGKK